MKVIKLKGLKQMHEKIIEIIIKESYPAREMDNHEKNVQLETCRGNVSLANGP